MDFPINLKSAHFVKGKDEFRQTVYLILKNQVGSFIQSRSLGLLTAPHSPADVVRFGVQETVKQIPSTEIESLTVQETPQGTLVVLELKYFDEFEAFQFYI